MIQNPEANTKTLQFYNRMILENKPWFEYQDVKFLLIAEKSSQIKNLRAVLPKEAKNIKIVSLAGHIMRLKNFEEYDTTLKNKSWFKMVKDSNIPFIPNKFDLVVKEKSTGKFKTDYQDMYFNIERAAKDVDLIISVTDPDNEGCALMLEVVQATKQQGKLLGQINMSKLDYFSLKQEIQTVDKIPFWTMANAGFARSEFDWSFGMNNTILASVLLGGGQTYHIGGVKSPVMRMIYDRKEHIENFKPEKYFQFKGNAKHTKSGVEFEFIVKVKQDSSKLDKLKLEISELEKTLESTDKEDENQKAVIQELYNKLGQCRWKLNEETREFETSERDIYSQLSRRQIEEKITQGKTFKVSKFNTLNNLHQNPPLAYSLTDLQADVGRSHNFSPAKTLQIAQKLYEDQWQSYPRTDNRYYSTGEMSNIQKIIPNLLNLTEFATVSIPTPYKPKTGIFNSSKVSAHTGLAPTPKEISNTALTGDARLVYTMVATRYLIQFMDKFEYYQVNTNIDVDASLYITTSQNIQTKLGWRELYNPKNLFGFSYTDTQTLPNMQEGDEIQILSLVRDNMETKPKPAFNEFSLLKGMENISRIYPQLQGLEKGIGTPATRASILEQLFKARYLIRRGKLVDISAKGCALMSLLPADMTAPQLRADMEEKLNDIVAGIITKEQYATFFSKMIKQQAVQLKEVAKIKGITLVDKATLPPSDAQLKFAAQMSKELKIKIPNSALQLKDEMTAWLKSNEAKMPILLSDKQYAFMKNYGFDVPEIIIILQSHDEKTLTKKQKFEASKWLGTFMRTSKFHKLRAAKATATRKANREAKMLALGITTPPVKLPARKKAKA